MIITLLTDFGTGSLYVAAMKGVMLSICPSASIIDISHTVQPYSIDEAAFILKQTYASFPRGTVHVVVVDPGVGSDRKPLIVQAGGHIFVAPDNGVLSPIFNTYRDCTVSAADNKDFWLDYVSATFHGRDIFAPIAAHLAWGRRAAEMGSPVSEFVVTKDKKPAARENTITGNILYIDHFGNAVTNIPDTMIPSNRVSIHAGDCVIDGLALTFSSVQELEPLAYIGSSGLLEIGINTGSAAKILGLRTGMPVSVDILKAEV